MAVRIVYVLNNKAPDVIRGAKSWLFRDGTLKILSGPLGAGQTKTLVEIREDFVLSVEHIKLEDGAKAGDNEAPKELEEAQAEPEKAQKGAPKPKKRAKRA